MPHARMHKIPARRSVKIAITITLNTFEKWNHLTWGLEFTHLIAL